MENRNVHFIVGIWRSGTTLLREILGMSDEVKIFPEHFVLLQQLKNSRNFNSEQKEQLFIEAKTNKDFLHFAQPNLTNLKQNIFNATSFQEAILSIYSSCLNQNSRAHTFIDKNPIYSYYLPQLLTLFPKAKFIWMLREPKDNCISREKHNIQYLKNYSYLATWWNKTNATIAKQAKQNPDRFLMVHYDDMVNHSEVWVERICNFLQIEFRQEMLAFETKKEERLTNFVLAAKARDGEISEEYALRKKAMWENLQKPINNLKVKQWETYLTESQITAVNQLTASYYQALLNQNFSIQPPSKLIYNVLYQLSLFKLKLDIQLKRIN